MEWKEKETSKQRNWKANSRELCMLKKKKRKEKREREGERG